MGITLEVALKRQLVASLETCGSCSLWIDPHASCEAGFLVVEHMKLLPCLITVIDVLSVVEKTTLARTY